MEIESWINFGSMPISWYLWAAKGMKVHLDPIQWFRVLLPEILAILQKAWEVEDKWQHKNFLDPTDGKSEWRKIDSKVDFILGSIGEGLKRMIKLLPSNDPLSKKAQNIFQTFFPEGVSKVIHLPVIEEYQYVKKINEDLQGKWAKDVDELGLKIWRDQLAKVLPEYDRVVSDMSLATISYEAVKNARIDAQKAMARLIVELLYWGLHHPENEAIIQQSLEYYQKILEHYQELKEKQEGDLDIDPKQGPKKLK